MALTLRDFDKYNDIVIQCHDNPDADALASGYALKWYLAKQGKEARFVYGGRSPVSKSNLVLMMENLGIQAEFVSELESPELLINVDCQNGESNVTRFKADNIAVIDHHQVSGPLPRLSEVRSNYGACATVMYELLQQEGIDINEDENLATALYYGLMTDTGGFAEVSHPSDRDLRDLARPRQTDIILFKNSNISREELKIAGDALKHAFYNEKMAYSIVEAKPCDPNILGIISDMLLEVDSVDTCLVYSILPFGIKISVRSCVKEAKASELASYIASGYGGGGGHLVKAGGLLKKDLQVGYVVATDIAAPGAKIMIRTLEGDVDVTIEEDLIIVIGVDGEIYPSNRQKFNATYTVSDDEYTYPGEYAPMVVNSETGERIKILPYAKSCIAQGGSGIYARELDHRVKVFTQWDPDKYYLGIKGDYLAVRADDPSDVYVIAREIFFKTYDEG